LVPAQVLIWQTIKEVVLGHRPAADLIRQGVYAVVCRIECSRCIKPTAIAAAEAAAVYATAGNSTKWTGGGLRKWQQAVTCRTLCMPRC
jgi:hypothetical protein